MSSWLSSTKTSSRCNNDAILPGFEPGIFCSVGRRVIRCATGPERANQLAFIDSTTITRTKYSLSHFYGKRVAVIVQWLGPFVVEKSSCNSEVTPVRIRVTAQPACRFVENHTKVVFISSSLSTKLLNTGDFKCVCQILTQHFYSKHDFLNFLAINYVGNKPLQLSGRALVS